MSCVPLSWLSFVAPIFRKTAVRNTGVEMRKIEMIALTRSDNRYCRIAFQTPSSTPSTMPMTDPTSRSRRLTPSRGQNASLTLLSWIVWPRLPCTASPSQCPYRTMTGVLSFTPMWSSLASTTAVGGAGLRSA